MNFTQEDYQKTKRISEAIQLFLLQTGMKEARSTDVYETLARKGLVEKDRHNGLHFRKFLQRLKDERLLHLIPQCTLRINDRGGNEWFFHLAGKPVNTTTGDVKTATVVHAPAMSKDDIAALIEHEKINVENLPKISNMLYTPQQLGIKRNYPRAYEIWTNDEYIILERVYMQCRQVDIVAALLQRQPHIVSEKLKMRKLIG